MTVLIQRIPSGPLQTNTYLLTSTSSDAAVVVDPAPESADTVLSHLLELQKTLTAIWITHSHWDHTADCHLFLSHQSVPVFVHPFDAENLIRPGSDGIPSSVSITPLTSLTYIKDGEVLHVGTSSWTVLHTPGHSLGSVCYYNAEEGILLSGDTLFKGTMGRVSFPTSSPHLMGDTLIKLASLPPNTTVYPGHGLSTTIARESTWMIASGRKLQEYPE